MRKRSFVIYGIALLLSIATNIIRNINNNITPEGFILVHLLFLSYLLSIWLIHYGLTGGIEND